MTADSGIHHHARGEMQAAGLSSRTIGLDRGTYSRFHHVLIVSDGWARILRSDTTAQRLHGPAIIHLPPSKGLGVSLEAGAQGVLIGASPDIMADAIGNKAESYSLRIFSELPFIAGEVTQRPMAEIQPLITGFVQELGDPARESWMVLSAYLRLILMTMWRMSASEHPAQRGRGEVTSILERYRQLVEVHFREHRPVRDYAFDLGISMDRLHAICQRTLGRSPIQLLHERLIHEARLRLERSAGTIQQISDGLGFRDPTYFSHFFKRNAGYSPASYRSMARSTDGNKAVLLASSYADWP